MSPAASSAVHRNINRWRGLVAHSHQLLPSHFIWLGWLHRGRPQPKAGAPKYFNCTPFRFFTSLRSVFVPPLLAGSRGKAERAQTLLGNDVMISPHAVVGLHYLLDIFSLEDSYRPGR